MTKQNFLLKISMVMGATVVLSVAALSLGGCSKESTTAASLESSDDAVSKAAAEAEAAEELMAAKKTNRKVASKESAYVVQVGTFKIESNAKKVMESLKSTGLPVVQKKIERSNGDVFYTVRIEPTPSRVEAEKFAAAVKSAVGTNSLILSVGR